MLPMNTFKDYSPWANSMKTTLEMDTIAHSSLHLENMYRDIIKITYKPYPYCDCCGIGFL